MPHNVFKRTESTLKDKGEFRHGDDATGKKGVSSRIKLIATLCVFANGIAFDALDEILELELSIAREPLLSFILLMV